MYKVAPLPGTFLITAIIGFLASAFLVPNENLSWKFTLLLFFAVMFIAAFISMSYGPVTRR